VGMDVAGVAESDTQALAPHLAGVDKEHGQEWVELQAPSRAGKEARLKVEERISALGLAFRCADPLRSTIATRRFRLGLEQSMGREMLNLFVRDELTAEDEAQDKCIFSRARRPPFRSSLARRYARRVC